jgi:hypothetical protein
VKKLLKYCLKKWDENKKILEERLKKDTSLIDCEYVYLVKMVVECILNQGDEVHEFDSENITVIDNGDYQGTQLFMIPMDSCQPEEYEYILTYVGYGSCSGCDTLQRIWEKSKRKTPTKLQLKDYMSLCKDIVANMVKPYDDGWRLNDDFETVEFKR